MEYVFFSKKTVRFLVITTLFPLFAQAQTFSSFSYFGNAVVNPASSWADFNNDGYADLLVTGNSYVSQYMEIPPGQVLLYQNNAGSGFSEVGGNLISGLPAFSYGAVAWGDYNRDGFVDFAISGLVNGVPQAYLYRNTGPANGWKFTQEALQIPATFMGCISWDDFNNDGFPDLFMNGKTSTTAGTGNPVSYLLSNNGVDGNFTFTTLSTSIPGLYNPSSDWADYNHDGWDDLLVSGQQSSGNYTYGITLVFTNLGNNTFGQMNSFSSNSGYHGNAAWGDYNSDGYVDILTVGSEYGGSFLFQNNAGSSFSTVNNTGIPAMSGGYAHWGDYNNDGKLDIAMVGLGTYSNGIFSGIQNIYSNNGNGTFTGISNPGLGTYFNANSSWADFDNDGDLDLFESGNTDNSSVGATFYKNNTNAAYTALPASTAPTNPRQGVIGNGVLLNWTRNNDPSLTYNVYLGKSPSYCGSVSPLSSTSTGERRITGIGNAGHTENLLVENLPSGTYYWSVQSVNTAWQGSPFATQGSFVIPGNQSVARIEMVSGSASFCTGSGPVLKAQSFPKGTAWQWYRNGSLLSGQTAQTTQANSSGTYTVRVTGTDNNSKQFSITSDGLAINAYPDPQAPVNPVGATICAGQTAILSASPGANASTCRWYNGGAYISEGNTASVSPSATTTYSCYSYSTQTGCLSSSATNITANVNPRPAQPSVPSGSGCNPSSVTLTATLAPGTECLWYGNNTDTASVIYSGTSFTTPLLGTSRYYYAAARNNSTSCMSARTAVYVNIVASPEAPTVQDAYRCSPGRLILSATPGNGGTNCRWYMLPTGGQPFHTGTRDTIANLTSDTVFFVATINGNCESSMRVAIKGELNPVFTKPFVQDQYGYAPSQGKTVQVTLFARPGTRGNTCRWYSSPSKSSVLATSDTYTTPALSSTHTYYVSTYDATTGCEGDSLSAIKAMIVVAPARKISPDQVYPVASMPVSQTNDGVNLNTGDVMLKYPIASIQAGTVSYELKAMYNSRSVAVLPVYTANPLGGLGWKLLDYPKMVYDDEKKRYFYLDGTNVYPLDTISQTGNTLNLRSSGEAWLSQFALDVSSVNMAQRKWVVTNEQGIQFVFNNAPQTSLSDGETGNIWHLGKIRDTQRQDSLTFTYNNGVLASILSPDGDKLEITIASNLITKVTQYRCNASGGNTVPINQVQLSYIHNYTPDNTKLILSGISSYNNGSLNLANGTQWIQTEPGLKFTYDNANYPGALGSVTYPEGGATRYHYDHQVSGGNLYYPVIQTDMLPGTDQVGNNAAHDSLPTAYVYERGRVSAPYMMYNKSTVYPGNISPAVYTTRLFTGFETGESDLVFKDLSSNDISSKQSIGGKKSYFLNTAGFNTRIHSHDFTLTNPEVFAAGKRDLPAADSITIGYWVYDTHQSLRVVTITVVSFYDINGDKIKDTSKLRSVEPPYYGQWINEVNKFRIPAGAVKFNFYIEGGGAFGGADCYLDNFSISGAAINQQGMKEFYFFNGLGPDSLLHLPDAYAEPYMTDSVQQIWFTGFETGTNFTSWLNLHGGSCKPVPTQNDASHNTAYAGSAALSMQSCNDGDKSYIETNALAIPSGTERIKVAFRYSNAEIKGMQFNVLLKWGGGQKDTSVTLDGSYLIDPGYKLYFAEFPVARNAGSLTMKVTVTHSGAATKINNFFIDNLRIVCLATQHSAGAPAMMNNTQDPLLSGKLYCSRVQKGNLTELRYQETCFYPTLLPSGSKVALPRTHLTVEKSTAINYSVLRYNNLGLPANATTTTELQDSLDQPFIQLGMRKFNYASEFYPQLGAGQYYMPTIPALQQTLTKRLGVGDWQVTSATITQWKDFSTNVNKPVFEPWRTYNLIGPVSTNGMDSVVNSLKSNPSWTPQAWRWAMLSNVTERTNKGLQVCTTDQLGTSLYVLYSSGNYTDPLSGKALALSPLPVAEFGNSTPQNAFYYGAESYENKPGTVSIAPVADFAFSGFYSLKNTVSMGYNFRESGADGQKYVVALRAMPQTTSFTVSIKENTTQTSINHVFQCPDSLQGKWSYFEMLFDINITSDSLTFSFTPATTTLPTYFDDIRFSAAAAGFSCSVYNMVNGTLTCGQGNNSEYQRFMADNSGDVVGTVRTGEIPVSLTAAYYSRGGISNNGNYAPGDPNSGLSVAAKSGGAFHSFNDVYHKNQWVFSGATLNKGSIKFNSNNTLTLNTHYLPTNMADMGIAFTFAPDMGVTSNQAFLLAMNQYNLKFTINSSTGINVQFYKNSPGNGSLNQTIKIPNTVNSVYPIDVILLTQGNKIMLWVNGIYLPVALAWDAASAKGIRFSTSNNSTVWLNNLRIFNDPMLNVEYTDGFGKMLQNQTLTGQGLIVTGVLYDQMMRPSVSTSPVLLSGHTPGYDQNLITAFDWVSGVMQGEVDEAHHYSDAGNDDDGYFYDRTDYEAAPEALSTSLYNPGKDFASRTYSNWEKARHWVHDHPDEIISDAFYAFDIINMILVPEDAPLIIIMNAAGMAISSAVGKIEDYVASKKGEPEAPDIPTTSYYYDLRRLTKEIKLPGANSHKDPQTAQVIRYEYDFVGNVSKLTTPESGQKTMVSDDLGRPRFRQDGQLKSDGKIMYIRYDNLGRPCEEGYYPAAWSYSALAQKRNDNQWPGAAQHPVVMRKYMYDGTGVGQDNKATYRGRLTSELSYHNGVKNHREDYTYNPEGKVIATAQSVEYPDAPKNSFYISYAFDNLGNLTHINYPPNNGNPFNVRYTFNKMNLMDTIFTSRDGKLVTYDWNPNGSLQHKRLYNSDRDATSFPVLFSFNAPGWKTNTFAGDTISGDPRYFNQKMDYNFVTGWWDELGGEKYYNGNIASSDYKTGKKTGVPFKQEGYTYDDYTSLAGYYSSYENDFYGTTDTQTPCDYDFDLNGNIKSRTLNVDSDQNLFKIKYKYHYDKPRNRTDYVAYSEAYPNGLPDDWKWWNMFWDQDSYYRYDTTFLAYDLAGNIASANCNQHQPVTADGGKGKLAFQLSRQFFFDEYGLMDSATISDADKNVNKCSFRYNTSGTRLYKDAWTTTKGSGHSLVNKHYRKTYIRGGGTDAIAELTHTLSGNGADTMRYYVMGATGGIECMFQDVGGSTNSWFVLADNKGSSTQLVNRGDRSVAAAWAYSDYGALEKDNCKNPQLFPYLFTGQEYDAELGVYNYKARIYDPALRIFLSPDPAMANPAQPYGYAQNNPINNVDPSGMIPSSLIRDILEAFKASDQFNRVSAERVAEIVDNPGHMKDYNFKKTFLGIQYGNKIVTNRADCLSCAIAAEMDPAEHITPKMVSDYLDSKGLGKYTNDWASHVQANGDEPFLQNYSGIEAMDDYYVKSEATNLRPSHKQNLVYRGGYAFETYEDALKMMAHHPAGTRFIIGAELKVPVLEEGVAGHAFNAEVFEYNGKNWVIFRDYQAGGEPMLKPRHLQVNKFKHTNLEFWINK